MKILKTISLSFLLLSLLQLHSQDEVMDYKDLQNYLPSSVNGYEAGEPSGSTMNMQGMSFSSAEIEFTNQDGDNVRVTLLDYTSAIMMYQAATAMWTAGISC